ncbi:MAG: histidine phosphatase family protein [Gammaproteobacteria bacterium]|nr:histidine phosphatase family protein [Gammaproteobacteria bacterium]
MIIDLIRHGTPVGGNRYRGHSIDDPLSEKGWQQMRETVGEYNEWGQIITSPMIRCYDFAKELSQRHDIPLKIIDDLKEVGFGQWEGKTSEQIEQQEYLDFYHDPVSNRPKGSEPLEDFTQRVVQSWESLLKGYQGQHLLVVAHAGVIRAVIAHVLHSEMLGMYKISVENGKICRIEVTERSGPVLKMLNGELN